MTRDVDGPLEPGVRTSSLPDGGTPLNESPVRVGVLSLHDSKETKAILNAVEALGHETEWLRLENIIVRLEGGETTLSPDVDVVANRHLLSNTDRPFEELGLAQTLSGIKPMLNTPDATARATHKTAAAVALSNDGLPVPKTVLSLSSHHLNQIRDEFAEEAVYKTAIGTHGGGTWKVRVDDSLAASVGNRRAFIQEFVGRTGETPRDLRVYVVDGQVVGAMYRYAIEGDWRTNVALGGRVEDATDAAPQAVFDLACRATSTLELDYAGVDLIEGDDVHLGGQSHGRVQRPVSCNRPKPSAAHREASHRARRGIGRSGQSREASVYARRLGAVLQTGSDPSHLRGADYHRIDRVGRG